jgi:DNA (cytosine-5)-methyltransferase 1
MDIREFNKLDDLPDELYHLDILDGSPPCTTFSTAGDREKSWGKKKKFREGQAEQTLDDLSFVFIETVNKLRPKTVIMENVEGLLLGNAYQYVLKIYQRFGAIGYQVKHWLLKGEEMGIPQKRHRVFFIAVRNDVEFDLTAINMDFNFMPIPFGLVADRDNRIEPSQTTLNLLQNAVPNEDLALSDVLWRLENKCSRFNEKIIWDDLVCLTIHSHGMYRGNDYSKLTRLDYLHCQTFPEDYDDLGQSISYICGMSVPPIMIKRVITKLIESGLFDYKNKDKNLL